MVLNGPNNVLKQLPDYIHLTADLPPVPIVDVGEENQAQEKLACGPRGRRQDHVHAAPDDEHLSNDVEKIWCQLRLEFNGNVPRRKPRCVKPESIGLVLDWNPRDRQRDAGIAITKNQIRKCETIALQVYVKCDPMVLTSDAATNRPTRRRGSDQLDFWVLAPSLEIWREILDGRQVDDLRASEEQQALDGIWLEVCAPRAMATRMSWIGKLAVRTAGGCESTRDSAEVQGLLWRQASWTGRLLQGERERRAGEMGAKGKRNWTEFEFLDHLRSACSDLDAINS
ncbi:hypothetical protein DFH09DRAFT_1290760 [Mycena vulgaris]|nr:hypothetical protein DFH09DRAFT_1290760 [Mycena vulgaris]